MFLVNPQTYLSVNQFKSQANDYSLTAYTDAQLQDLLVRASGRVDAILRRSFQPQRQTIRYLGDGSNILMLRERPIIYVSRIQFVLPGMVGFSVPVNQMLIDYQQGEVLEYTPLMFQGLGYASIFPRNMPIDVTLAWGYSFPIPPPSWTAADIAPQGPGLMPGAYVIAVTSKTMWGESMAVPQVFTTATGNIQITITPSVGTYIYAIYAGQGVATVLTAATAIAATAFTVASPTGAVAGKQIILGAGTAVAEVLTVASVVGSVISTTSGAIYAHGIGDTVFPNIGLVAETPSTSYGNSPIGTNFNSVATPPDLIPVTLPTQDTSANPLPTAIVEGTRLIALQILYEDNNLSNRGIAKTQSGRKSVAWRSTEGNSGKGVPLMEQQAREMLKPYSLQAIY
jgi:hypothetical protein